MHRRVQLWSAHVVWTETCLLILVDTLQVQRASDNPGARCVLLLVRNTYGIILRRQYSILSFTWCAWRCHNRHSQTVRASTYAWCDQGEGVLRKVGSVCGSIPLTISPVLIVVLGPRQEGSSPWHFLELKLSRADISHTPFLGDFKCKFRSLIRRGNLDKIGNIANAFACQIGSHFSFTLVVICFKSDKCLYDF